MEDLLADIHKPSGLSYEQHWQRRYPAYDGGHPERPTVREVVLEAWDHQARRKRTDMPRYVEGWLRRDYWRAERSLRLSGDPGATTGCPPPADLHGNAIVLPDGYVWDERDEANLREGCHWTGTGWRMSA